VNDSEIPKEDLYSDSPNFEVRVHIIVHKYKIPQLESCIVQLELRGSSDRTVLVVVSKSSVHVITDKNDLYYWFAITIVSSMDRNINTFISMIDDD
jgi:hypothetical protein